MTNDEILQAAKEAGIEKWWDTPNATEQGYRQAMLKMGKIIEKRTIERCAVAADAAYATDEVIAAIRKLGEHE